MPTKAELEARIQVLEAENLEMKKTLRLKDEVHGEALKEARAEADRSYVVVVEERLKTVEAALATEKQRFDSAVMQNARLHAELECLKNSVTPTPVMADPLKSLLHLLGMRTDKRENPEHPSHLQFWEKLQVVREEQYLIWFPREFYVVNKDRCRKFLEYFRETAHVRRYPAAFNRNGLRITIVGDNGEMMTDCSQ